MDNDEIADRIIKYMIHEKAGRANFMPLNRLRTEDVHYPTEFGTDVVPLLKKLKFNPAFTPAMKQVHYEMDSICFFMVAVGVAHCVAAY